MTTLLTATEAAKFLEIPRSTFYLHRGAFHVCLAPRQNWIGRRKYSAALLDDFKAQRPIVKLRRVS